MTKKKVGVLGATGTVGQRIIHMLRDHPWYDVTSLHAGSSAGNVYGDAVNWLLPAGVPEKVKELTIQTTTPETADVDFVFSALPSGVAKEVEPQFAEAGIPVVSNAGAYRMHKDVPLVVPEVNPDHIKLIETQREKRGWDGFIATDPNCSTINFVLAMKPIVDLYTVKRVFVTTMQAISGAGYPGLPSLDIIENVIPYIGGEEEKMETEPLKILGILEKGGVQDIHFNISAQCNRVPSIDGHLEAIYLEAEEKIDIDELKAAVKGFTSRAQELKLPTAPVDPLILREEPNRPQTRLDRLAGSVPGMAVSIGRIRHGLDAKSLRLVCLGHNTIRGAAGGAITLAELLSAEGYL
jgi:aspartate-semialdehyde dehydrogenase